MPSYYSYRSRRYPYARRRYSRRSYSRPYYARSRISGPPVGATQAIGTTRYFSLLRTPSKSATLERVVSTLAVPSTASGVIANVYNNNPTGYTNFTQVAGLFHSYRPVAIRFTWEPKDPAGTTLSHNAMICVYDNSDGIALTGYTDGLQYANTVEFNTSKRKTWKWNLVSQTPLSAQWINVGSPIPTGYFKFYADTLTNTSVYGMIIVEMILQCKDRI